MEPMRYGGAPPAGMEPEPRVGPNRLAPRKWRTETSPLARGGRDGTRSPLIQSSRVLARWLPTGYLGIRNLVDLTGIEPVTS